MKKILVLVLIISVIFLCGFGRKEKPYIIMSAGTVSKETINRIERVFMAGQRINYAIIAPDGFKYDAVRLQISKRDEKTSNWGFSIIQSRDIYIDKSADIINDYILIQRPGRYIIQFFYLNNKDYPFIHREFWVQ